MSETLGTRLRRHRERRGLTVAEIAEQTKIKASLLEGLERDDVSLWPAGIFRRAYVRAYASAIGFDADAAVREFLVLYPDPPETNEVPPPRGLRGFVASALGTLRRQPATEPTSGVTSIVDRGVVDKAVLDGAASEKPAFEKAASEKPFFEKPVVENASVETLRVEKRVEMVRRPAEPEAPRPGTGPRQDDRRADDLLAAARICTELGRVEQIGQVLPLLRDAARVLDARGLIVWVWDAVAEQLRPAFVHGYTSKVRARLRGVSRDADNVTAAAFRAGAPLAKAGEGGASGALAVPLLTPGGCGGVLAIEVTPGAEQDAVVRALATFFAAMLSQLVGASPAEAASDPASLPALEAQPG